MAITVLPGPIDKLNAGILAGARLAALATRGKHLKAQNALDLKRLQLQTTELLSRDTLRGLQGEAARTETEFNTLRAEALAQELEAGGPAAKVGAQKAATSARQSLEMTRLLEAGIPVLDDDFTLAESQALAGAFMVQAGIEDTPANLTVWNAIAQGKFQKEKSDREIEILRANSYAAAQQAIVGVRVPAGIQAAIDVTETKAKATDKQIDILTQRISLIDSDTDDKDLIKKRQRLESEKRGLIEESKSIEDKLIRGFQRLQKFSNPQQQQPAAPVQEAPQTQQFPGAPPIGTTVNGFRYVGGDPIKESSWKKVK